MKRENVKFTYQTRLVASIGLLLINKTPDIMATVEEVGKDAQSGSDKEEEMPELENQGKIIIKS